MAKIFGKKSDEYEKSDIDVNVLFTKNSTSKTMIGTK